MSELRDDYDEPEKQSNTGPGGDAGSPEESPRKLLISRANLLVGPRYRQHRMFVQFDAWTETDTLRWLEKHGKHLPANAKKLFENSRPGVDIELLNCGFA